MPHNKLLFTISERKIFLRILDIGYVFLGLFILNYSFDFNYFNFEDDQILTWVFTLIIYLLLFGEIFELYNLKTASDKYLTFKSAFITVAFVTVLFVFTPRFSPLLPQNRIQIIFFAITVFCGILLNRIIYIQFIFSPRFLKNLLLIGDSNAIEFLFEKVEHNQNNRFVGYVSNSAIAKYPDLKFTALQTANIEELLKTLDINEILVSPSFNDFNSRNINVQLIELFEKGISIRSFDSFLEDETFKISENQLISNFYNYFSFSKNHQNNLYLAFNRLMDILFSIVGIVLMLVLIPFIFLLNLLGNRGKLFYFQRRVGRRGTEFNIIKFRTMVSNAEENGAVWAKKKDSRITAFGRVLRKTRLDEVPQFINVLKGEMGLIGPRPERPEMIVQLEKELPYYSLRHVIKPGLTGWAQVKHPYAHTVEDQQEKLLYDLYYIKERSAILDLKIVIKTISTILFFRGT